MHGQIGWLVYVVCTICGTSRATLKIHAMMIKYPKGRFKTCYSSDFLELFQL